MGKPRWASGKDAATKGTIEKLRRQGWTVSLTAKGHIRCVPPNKSARVVVQSGTPSDQRAYANWISQLKRSGYKAREPQVQACAVRRCP